MGIGLSVVLLVGCLLFSAFFSSLETALTSLPEARLKKLIDKRPLAAQALLLWVKSPNLILTTILVGNNIVNTLAAAVGTVLAQAIFDNFAISVATFFITVLVLVFGEVTPKTFARHNAELIIPAGLTLLLPIYGILFPITWVMSNFSALLVKKAGGHVNSTQPLATEEDIAYLIRLGHQEGVLKPNEGHLLQSVIDFRDTVVKESMVPRMEIGSFELHTGFEDILARVIKEGHTRWPVYENNIDNIVGIFHAKDLLNHLERNPQKPFSLQGLLRPAKFVPDTMKVGSLLKEFQAGKAHLAIVVDEYGGTAGIISLEDVLEELVGEIRDEYDDEEHERTIQQIDAENYVVNGKANIFELGKILNVAFPESDAFDSLGGFLVSVHGRMPRVGTKLNFANCTFAIKAADEKKIVQVHINQIKESKKRLNQRQDTAQSERAAA